MRRDPTPATLNKQQGGAAGPIERFATRACTKRIPWHNDAYDVTVAQRVDFVQTKSKVADVWPDVAPLLVLQTVSAGDHRGVRAKGDNVFGKQRPSPSEIDGLNARLHLREERARCSGCIHAIRIAHLVPPLELEVAQSSPMQIGAVLSQSELGPEVAALRDYVQAVQDLGFDFLVTADHVVGADHKDHADMDRVFSIDSYLREPLMLGAFLACAAPRLGYLTSVVILPQRQTVLVAKQAADLDVFLGGKLRLGVGIGWNPLEFEALGVPFKTRARRFEEQIDLMRRVWTERVVSFEGSFHAINAAGINPRPVQQPIPIWAGAHSEPAVKRATRIADGYLPLRPLEGGWTATMDRIHAWLAQAGRDPSTFGIEGRLDAGQGTPDDWRKVADMWRGFNASHLSVSTNGAGRGAQAHIERLRQAKEVLS